MIKEEGLWEGGKWEGRAEKGKGKFSPQRFLPGLITTHDVPYRHCCGYACWAT